MTTSAIRFRAESIEVADTELREFIKAAAHHLADHDRDRAGAAGWLVEACAGRMDVQDGFPPGLRDLELDEVITTPERFRALADYLSWLTRMAPPSATYDAPSARRTIERVFTKWPVP